MQKQLLGLFSLALASVLAFGTPARADSIDPFFTEALSNSCPANCTGAFLASDPLSGKTTLEFVFNSTIPRVVAGDVKVPEFGSSTIGDVIRFENLSSVAVAFIFSNDIAGGQPADVGLPSSFQANVAMMTAENSSGNTGFSYFPTSSQPGFCLTAAGAACSSSAGYGLQSGDAPEPGSLALFVAALFGLQIVQRRGRGRPKAV